jgi:hypothetical protein
MKNIKSMECVPGIIDHCERDLKCLYLSHRLYFSTICMEEPSKTRKHQSENPFSVLRFDAATGSIRRRGAKHSSTAEMESH